MCHLLVLRLLFFSLLIRMIFPLRLDSIALYISDFLKFLVITCVLSHLLHNFYEHILPRIPT